MIPEIHVVYSELDVLRRVARVAQEIDATGHQEIMLVIMLRGGAWFGIDLSRALYRRHVPIVVDFMNVTLNDDDGTRREPRFILKPVGSVKDKNVVVVDDSVGSGETYLIAKQYLLDEGAASVQLAVVINCFGAWEKKALPDFRCYDVPDKAFYRVGYGEDINGRLRELPFIAAYPEDEFFRALAQK